MSSTTEVGVHRPGTTEPPGVAPTAPVTVAVVGLLLARRRERQRWEALRRSGSWPLSVWWDEALGNCRE
ncbi:MYXO-CTERM sorting domain-containing protein [Kineococcus endophyticus]|uniref:MYXO-CTERM sorting domain-containing protein n=1 Tax=Kineococcus endophyticus TaxID=1181883 RepID=A0ABV3P4P8_9ACTN